MVRRNVPSPLPGDLHVERLVAWREEEDGVVLLVPRFGRGRTGRFLGRLLRREAPIHVRLDALGSRAWLSMEPGRSLEEIARLVDGDPTAADAGAPAGTDAAGRLDRFLRRLCREGWIRLLRHEGRRRGQSTR